MRRQPPVVFTIPMPPVLPNEEENFRRNLRLSRLILIHRVECVATTSHKVYLVAKQRDADRFLRKYHLAQRIGVL